MVSIISLMRAGLISHVGKEFGDSLAARSKVTTTISAKSWLENVVRRGCAHKEVTGFAKVPAVSEGESRKENLWKHQIKLVPRGVNRRQSWKTSSRKPRRFADACRNKRLPP